MSESLSSEPEPVPRTPGLGARLRHGGRARTLLVVAVVAAVVVGALAFRHFSGRESTDDAQVDGHVVPVAARVGGTVLSVHVKDNEPVEKGALLVRIDPRDYEVAAARAAADLAENEATARAAQTTVPLTSITATSQE